MCALSPELADDCPDKVEMQALLDRVVANRGPPASITSGAGQGVRTQAEAQSSKNVIPGNDLQWSQSPPEDESAFPSFLASSPSERCWTCDDGTLYWDCPLHNAIIAHMNPSKQWPFENRQE